MPCSIPEIAIGQDIDDVGGPVPFAQEPCARLCCRGGLPLLPHGDPFNLRDKGGRQTTLRSRLHLKGQKSALYQLAHAGGDLSPIFPPG